MERARLGGARQGDVERPKLSAGGWTALIGIGLTAAALMAVSAFDRPLGLPTSILGALTTALALLRARASTWPVLKGVSWGILPLVAGLFVLVEALDRTGVVALLASGLERAA